MAISAPLSIGSGTTTLATAPTMTTSGNASASGSAIVVFVSANGASLNPVFTTCTDSAGNSYTAGPSGFTIGSGSLKIYYKLNAAALGIGGTISVAGSDFGAGSQISAVTVPAPPLALDHSSNGTFANSAAFSLNTGALLGPSTLILLGLDIENGVGDVFTQDATFTSLTTAGVLDILRPSYRIASGTGAVTYGATGGTVRAWGTVALLLQEAAGASGKRQMGLKLGIGL